LTNSEKKYELKKKRKIRIEMSSLVGRHERT